MAPKATMLVHYTTGLLQAFFTVLTNKNFNLKLTRGTELGVNLTPIILKRTPSLDELRDKSLAVDANNYLYKFPSVNSSIKWSPVKRQKRQHHLAPRRITISFYTPHPRLQDKSARYRIKLILALDCKPPKQKEKEIIKRHEQRRKALTECNQALEKGDLATAWSKGRDDKSPDNPSS